MFLIKYIPFILYKYVSILIRTNFYRIGQQNTVNIYYPIADNTLDIQIFNILQKKKDIINTVMGETSDNVTIDEDLFKELVKIGPLKKLKM